MLYGTDEQMNNNGCNRCLCVIVDLLKMRDFWPGSILGNKLGRIGLMEVKDSSRSRE